MYGYGCGYVYGSGCKITISKKNNDRAQTKALIKFVIGIVTFNNKNPTHTYALTQLDEKPSK